MKVEAHSWVAPARPAVTHFTLSRPFASSPDVAELEAALKDLRAAGAPDDAYVQMAGDRVLASWKRS